MVDALREQRLFRSVAPSPLTRALRRHAFVALVVSMFAIKLGVWSTANHAALDCPTCPGAYWPVVHFAESLPRWTAVGLATTVRSSTLAPPQPYTSLIAPRR